jgi:hypothetical protein
MPIECGLVVVAEHHCLRLYPLHIWAIVIVLSESGICYHCVLFNYPASTCWACPHIEHCLIFLDRFLHTGVIVGLRVLWKKVAISIFVIRISDGFVCIILFLQHALSLGTRLLAATLVKMS